MLGIQDNAEKVVRNLLRQVHDQFSGLPLEAEDQMDDGSKLVLKIHINRDEGSAKFDFTGTSREMATSMPHEPSPSVLSSMS